MKEISKREFVKCSYYKTDVPKFDCPSCEYHIAETNHCGFCRFSSNKRVISKRDVFLNLNED
jgi:hypothetical protein